MSVNLFLSSLDNKGIIIIIIMICISAQRMEENVNFSQILKGK